MNNIRANSLLNSKTLAMTACEIRNKVSTNHKDIVRPFSTNLFHEFSRGLFYKSLITIDYWDLLKDPKVFKIFIEAFQSKYQPATGKHTVTTTAIKMILFLPISYLMMSTQFIEFAYQHNKVITLPVYFDRLLSKFSLRTIRPLSGSQPGMNGTIVYRGLSTENFGDRLLELLTPEFIYKVTVGTIFNKLSESYQVEAEYSKEGNLISGAYTKYRVDSHLMDGLRDECLKLNVKLYSYEFYDVLNEFYLNVNSSFHARSPVPLVTRQINELDTTHFGAHKLRNHVEDDTFYMHVNFTDSFGSEESQNLLLLFLYLYKPKYLTQEGNSMTVAGNYKPLAGDVLLDLTVLDHVSMFRSLLSLEIIIPKDDNAEDPKDGQETEFNVNKGNKTKEELKRLKRLLKRKDKSGQVGDITAKTGTRSYSTMRSVPDRQQLYINLRSQDGRASPKVVYKIGWPITFAHLGDRGLTPILVH